MRTSQNTKINVAGNADVAKNNKNQLRDTIVTAIEASRRSQVPVLFFSNPGYGKTTTIKNYANKIGYHVESLIGSQFSQDEILGFQANTGAGHLEVLEPQWYSRIMAAKAEGKASILFLDELSTVSGRVQGALLQLCFEREIRGGKKLPEDCVVVSAANYKQNLPSYSEIIAPQLNRFAVINLLANENNDLMSNAFSVVDEFIQDFKETEIEIPTFADKTLSAEESAELVTRVNMAFKNLFKVYTQTKDISIGHLDMRNISYDGIYDRGDDLPEVLNFVSGRTLSYYTRLVKSLIEMGIDSTNDIYKKFVDGLIGLGTNSWEEDNYQARQAQIQKYRSKTWVMTAKLLDSFKDSNKSLFANGGVSGSSILDTKTIAGKVRNFIGEMNYGDNSVLMSTEFAAIARDVLVEYDVKSVDALTAKLSSSQNKVADILAFKTDYEAISLFATNLEGKLSEIPELSYYIDPIKKVLDAYKDYYETASLNISSENL